MSAPCRRSCRAGPTYGLLPLLNLAARLPRLRRWSSSLVGENPLEAVAAILVYGAFGYGEAVGYTLYYATNFIFTGLAVAVAFHAGLFNIGGEGQAYIGGLGSALVGLYLGWLPGVLSIPLAVAGGGAVRRRLGPSSRAGCRPGAAATSSSPRSCSTSSPRR